MFCRGKVVEFIRRQKHHIVVDRFGQVKIAYAIVMLLRGIRMVVHHHMHVSYAHHFILAIMLISHASFSTHSIQVQLQRYLIP